MKTRTLLVGITALLAFSAHSTPAAGLLDLLIGKNDLETFTVTDFTQDGRQRRLPTPDKPVYYAALSGGYMDLGGIIAGEKPIPRDQMNSTVLKALAKQGYLPAPADKSPEMIVIWRWGTLNAIMTPLPSNSLYGSTFMVQVNERALRRFLGGAKLGLVSQDPSMMPDDLLSQGLTFPTGNAAALMSAARDDLYVATISAYDCRVDARGKPVLLWNTRISAPSRGFTMPEALPAMLAIATPFIGRETDKPMWIRAGDHFKPDIKIGDPTVVSYLEEQLPTVANLGRNK